ncbi:MAG: ABC transporter permease [Candidatus Hodarchaeota archaeon]
MVKTNRLGLPNTSYGTRTAIGHAVNNIRQRKGRTLITGAGVILGVSFIITLITYSRLVDYFDPTSNIAREQSYLILVGLLLCVVGVANSMYMEIGQRSSEIGTYMTLGTLPRHVIKLFMFESLFIGLISGFIGSLLGIILGIFLTALEFPLNEITVQLELNSSLYVVLFFSGSLLACALTTIASILPVYSASRLNPADALRRT